MDRIEAERLYMRPFVIDDAEAAYEWTSDPEVSKFMPYSIHTDICQTKSWLESVINKNEFAICLKESGTVICAMDDGIMKGRV